MKNIENLVNNIENANTTSKLSNAFDNVTKALNKSCESIYKSIFDYKFSTYLYIHYILQNETKYEIAKKLNISSSTIYYYIRRYKLKKDLKARQQKMLETMKYTCNEKYGVDHPGELLSTHRNRIKNILNKSNNNYSKLFYKKLNKTDETKERMKIAQQYRRKCEKEGE